MNLTRITPLIVGASLFMENLDSAAIATALPSIAADLGTSPLTLKLAITSYLVAFAVAIPASGWLADRFGSRNVFTCAMITFMAGSLACAFAGSIVDFVIARVIEGMGAAMMTPVSRTVMLRTVKKTDLVVAMTIVAVPGQLGPLLGPTLGGFVTTYWSWHWIFLINIPIGLLGIVLAQIFFPKFDVEQGKFDFKGFVLSGVGLAGIAFGLSVAGFKLLPWPIVAAIIATGAISMTLYVRHYKTVTQPVLDFGLLKLPTIRVIATGGALFRAGMGAMPFLLPLLFQVGFGMSALQSGLLVLASALGSFGTRLISSRFIRRHGFRKVMFVNAIIAGAFLGVNALFTISTPIVVIFALLFVAGFFRSVQLTSMNTLVYAEVDHAQLSRASTLVSVIQQLSISMGVAVGALSVELTRTVSHDPTLGADDFAPAFIVVMLMAMASCYFFYRLPVHAGHQIAGPKPKEHQREP